MSWKQNKYQHHKSLLSHRECYHFLGNIVTYLRWVRTQPSSSVVTPSHSWLGPGGLPVFLTLSLVTISFTVTIYYLICVGKRLNIGSLLATLGGAGAVLPRRRATLSTFCSSGSEETSQSFSKSLTEIWTLGPESLADLPPVIAGPAGLMDFRSTWKAFNSLVVNIQDESLKDGG